MEQVKKSLLFWAASFLMALLLMIVFNGFVASVFGIKEISLLESFGLFVFLQIVAFIFNDGWRRLYTWYE